ncbi:hypothetical protein PROFUN_07584 [Planoprotostelium fungivorum]|uniref:Uncharacterized protein n=1 Tax=Planoprotostelium fungivorum TaxID=1890364 RepID=A0A2P6NLT3_9EUKA|nr:hypothetical protein PROFUN_07584 [Planoprotostelium fungivorum]
MDEGIDLPSEGDHGQMILVDLSKLSRAAAQKKEKSKSAKNPFKALNSFGKARSSGNLTADAAASPKKENRSKSVVIGTRRRGAISIQPPEIDTTAMYHKFEKMFEKTRQEKEDKAKRGPIGLLSTRSRVGTAPVQQKSGLHGPSYHGNVLGLSKMTIHSKREKPPGEQPSQKTLRRCRSLSSIWRNTWDIQPYTFDEDKWKNRWKRAISDADLFEPEMNIMDAKNTIQLDQVVSQPIPNAASKVLDTKLVYEQVGDRIVLTGGTIERLIDKLVWDERIDLVYVQDFLYCFPTFIKSRELMDKMEDFLQDAKKNITMATTPEKKTTAVSQMLRIVNVLHRWIQIAPSDFNEDLNLRKRLIQMIDGTINDNVERTWVDLLRCALQKRCSDGLFAMSTWQTSPILIEAAILRPGQIDWKSEYKKGMRYYYTEGSNIVDWVMSNVTRDVGTSRQDITKWIHTTFYRPKHLLDVDRKSDFKLRGSAENLTFEDGESSYRFRIVPLIRPQLPPRPKKVSDAVFLLSDPKEIAKQMTLISEELFYPITGRLLVTQTWSDKGSDTCQSVKEFTDRFNDVAMWVATEIVASGNMSQRREIISRFIEVAASLHKMRNFSDFIAVMAGLNHWCVSRLKKTWEGVSSKSKKDLNALEGHSPAYTKVLRNDHNGAEAPAIPYLGLLVGDLIRLNEVPALLPSGYINFGKGRIQATMLRQIDGYKEKQYNYKPSANMLAWLRRLIIIPEKGMATLSMQWESASS